MHCFNLTVIYALLPKSSALYPECVHYRLNWAEKGVLWSQSTEIVTCQRHTPQRHYPRVRDTIHAKSLALFELNPRPDRGVGATPPEVFRR